MTDENAPQIYAVTTLETGEYRFSRRDFLRAAGILGAAGALAGCSGSNHPIPTVPPPESALNPANMESYCANYLSHTGTVKAVAVTPDGTLLISCGVDKLIRIWALEGEYRGRLLNTLDGHEGTVNALVVMPGGDMFISGGDDKIILWSLPDGRKMKTLDRAASALALSADGAVLASGREEQIALWSMPDGYLLNTLDAHTGGINALAFSADGTMLASAGNDLTVKLWTLPEGGRPVSSTQRRAVQALGFNGQTLLIGADPIQQIDMIERASLPSLRVGAPVTAMAINADGTLLATGDEDGSIKVWTLPDGTLQESHIARHIGSRDPVTALAFTGEKLVAVYFANAPIQVRTVQNLAFETCMIDMAALPKERHGTQVEMEGVAGILFLPCGAAIPAGAVCTCNCVSGTACGCVGYGTGRSGSRTGAYWYPN